MTDEQYVLAKQKLAAYTEASEAWMNANKTRGIPSEICAAFPYATDITNDLRSEIEVYEFINTPPDKCFLYINEEKQTATTWTGDKLGNVTFGRSYKSNLGDTRQSVSIWAINGLTYYGTYYKSSGNYARVKARKAN